MINLTKLILVCVSPHIDTLTNAHAQQLFEPLEPELPPEIGNSDSALTGNQIKRDKRNVLKSIMNG